MKTKCFLCGEEFVNILEHVSTIHEISSIEDYKGKAKQKEDRNIKIKAFLDYKEELMEKLRKGKITPEKLRELRIEWEKDNDLKW